MGNSSVKSHELSASKRRKNRNGTIFLIDPRENNIRREYSFMLCENFYAFIDNLKIFKNESIDKNI